MTREAIILAGGLGTRLQKVVGDLPKPMADINGKPFLVYLLNFLIEQGIEKVILSVGYKHEAIKSYFKDQYNTLKIEYSIETELLGTGGGIKKAAGLCGSDTVFVLNGDTFFNISLEKLLQFHHANRADIAIALKPMHQFDRYGSVNINEENRITGFSPKGGPSIVAGESQRVGKVLPLGEDLGGAAINAGIYTLNKSLFDELGLPEKFSFETDVLKQCHADKRFYGMEFDEYFIDIGLPEDYEKAQDELRLTTDL